jgi:hypothetical protein
MNIFAPHHKRTTIIGQYRPAFIWSAALQRRFRPRTQTHLIDPGR